MLYCEDKVLFIVFVLDIRKICFSALVDDAFLSSGPSLGIVYFQDFDDLMIMLDKIDLFLLRCYRK
jgi:hypothetical protein